MAKDNKVLNFVLRVMNLLNQKVGMRKFLLVVIGFIVIFFLVVFWGIEVLIIPLLFFIFFIRSSNFFSNFFNNFTFNKINMTNQVPSFENYSMQFKEKISKGRRFLKIVVLLLLLIWLISSFVVVIGVGETGVVSLFGKVRDEELSSGIHLVNPLMKVQKMNIRTEHYTMSIASSEGQRKGDDSISALTKEGLDISIDFTALYHLEEAKASDIYREVGLDYVEKIIRPEIRGIIRNVVSQYEAKELYSEKRQEASNRIYSELREKLNPRGMILEEAVIRNVGLPVSLTKAIQEKLASEQEAQKYDFVLDKEKKEAERKRIEAEGQRDAQKIINESLSAEYLNYLYIKELKDRQGTIYVPVNPANGMPFFKEIGQ